MNKIYVLDTNVLLLDPHSLLAFEDRDVIVPLKVIEELDRKKTMTGEIGYNASQMKKYWKIWKSATIILIRKQSKNISGRRIRCPKMNLSSLSIQMAPLKPENTGMVSLFPLTGII